MSEHKPGAKPIDPDSTSPGNAADEVKKRDMPGNPHGVDQPQKPDEASPQDGE